MKNLLASLVLSIFVVGCGGTMSSSNPTSSPAPPASTARTQQMTAGALEGFHGTTAKTTTTHSFSLLPKVYAQTTTSINLTGGYSGFMGTYPPLELAQPTGAVAYPIYGVGSFVSLCQSFQGGSVNPTQLCPFAQASGMMSAGQVLATQGVTPGPANLVNPAFVTGAGTLGPLVVYGSAGTNSSGSAVIEVWVLRNGAVMNTGITCSLTVTTAPNAPPTRCTSTTSFSVQDEDQIVGTITINNAFLSNVVFFLGKS
jgi:hypothetical protein